MKTPPHRDTYRHRFTDQCQVSIPGTLHQLGTTHLAIRAEGDHMVWVPGRGWQAEILGYAVITLDPVTYDITVTFVISQSGTIVLEHLGT